MRLSNSEELHEEVQILRALMHERPPGEAILQWEIQGEYRAIHPMRLHKRILDSAGRTLLETPKMKEDLPVGVFAAPPSESAEPSVVMTTYEGTHHHWLVATARARFGTTGDDRILQLGMDVSQDRALLARYRRKLWTVLLISLAPIVLLGRSIARRGIQPCLLYTSDAADE